MTMQAAAPRVSMLIVEREEGRLAFTHDYFGRRLVFRQIPAALIFDRDPSEDVMKAEEYLEGERIGFNPTFRENLLKLASKHH